MYKPAEYITGVYKQELTLHAEQQRMFCFMANARYRNAKRTAVISGSCSSSELKFMTDYNPPMPWITLSLIQLIRETRRLIAKMKSANRVLPVKYVSDPDCINPIVVPVPQSKIDQGVGL